MKTFSFTADFTVDADSRETALSKIADHLKDHARLSADGESKKLGHEEFDGDLNLVEAKKKVR